MCIWIGGDSRDDEIGRDIQSIQPWTGTATICIYVEPDEKKKKWSVDLNIIDIITVRSLASPLKGVAYNAPV